MQPNGADAQSLWPGDTSKLAIIVRSVGIEESGGYLINQVSPVIQFHCRTSLPLFK